MKRFSSVEEYIEGHPQWSDKLMQLREIVLSTGLEEAVKWGAPIYTCEGKNVVGIGAFKSYVGLWFHQGVFLSDPAQKLLNAQEGKTKALRQWRFNPDEDLEVELIRSYVEEARRNQLDGKEIKPAQGKPLVIPDELKQALAGNPALNSSFESFSLSKQREFTEYIGQAKRAETRQKRLEKCLPMIEQGVGLNDKYR